MADQNTSLPVRSEGDVDSKVQVRIVDSVDPTRMAQVDADKNLHVELHGNDPAGVDRVVKTSESGHIAQDGVYDVASNTVPTSAGLIAHVRNAAKTIVHQLKRITAIDSTVDIGVTAMDVAIRDEKGNPFTAANPLPTTSVDSEGEEVNNYKAATVVAAGASDSHDYTVTAAKTFKFSKVTASASGKMKMVISIETGVASGVFNPVFTMFNSTANTNCDLDIKENITVAAGIRVRVVLTNRDLLPQDLYSTICGHEI